MRAPGHRRTCRRARRARPTTGRVIHRYVGPRTKSQSPNTVVSGSASRLLKNSFQQPACGPRMARRNQARSLVLDFGSAAKVAPFARAVEKCMDSIFQQPTSAFPPPALLDPGTTALPDRPSASPAVLTLRGTATAGTSIPPSCIPRALPLPAWRQPARAPGCTSGRCPRRQSNSAPAAIGYRPGAHSRRGRTRPGPRSQPPTRVQCALPYRVPGPRAIHSLQAFGASGPVDSRLPPTRRNSP